MVRARGIIPVIARRGAPHGSGLGHVRSVVERTFAWLHAFKRLRTRYERRADTHEALISVACSVICLRILTHQSETIS
jgi:transposase